MMKYFFTGSQVYGSKYKTEDSDIDIAILITADEFTMLRKLCSCGQDRVGPLMFGKINFVCFNSDYDEEKSRFYTWHRITEYLKENPPETKDQAIEKFREQDVERQYFIYGVDYAKAPQDENNTPTSAKRKVEIELDIPEGYEFVEFRQDDLINNNVNEPHCEAAVILRPIAPPLELETKATKLMELNCKHAAEVLARTFYNFENQGDMATPWDLIECEQKQFYINRAIEELKK
jgi:hypothetical protein